MDGAVVQAVDKLAEALQHIPEWEESASANAALKRDHEVATLRARVRELSETWQRSRSADGTLPEGNGLADLQRTLQAHPVVVRQQEASRVLVVLFQQTNDLLSSMLEVDFAASGVRRTGGCCGS